MTVSIIDATPILGQFVEQASLALSERIGPHLLEACQAKAPVGKEHNLTQRRSLRPVSLKPVGSFTFGSDAAHRLSELSGFKEAGELGANVNPLTDAKFFQGVTDPHYKNPKRNKGKTPTLIEVTARGGVRGGFKHRVGTLRDSHVLDPVKVEGHTVSVKVRATAPYAYYVHEGFSHRGDGSQVKGRKWMVEALRVNIADDLKSPFK